MSGRHSNDVDGERAGTTEEPRVRRDEFLHGAGAVMVGWLTAPLYDHEQRAPVVSEVTDAFVDHVRAQLEGLRWLDRREGALRHLAGTSRHAHGLIDVWRSLPADHALSAPVARIAADACHLVAYQAFDQGGRERAVTWYQVAADLAARAGDSDLRVLAVCGVAFMHVQSGDHRRALQLLHRLHSTARSAAAHCYVAVYQAHAHATARAVDDAGAALDRAAVLAAVTGHEPPSSCLGVSDGAFVARHHALVGARIGSATAVDDLRRLDQSTADVFRRFRIGIAADLASVHARRGDIDEAARQLGKAATLNRSVASAEKTARIRATRTALEPYRTSRAVTDLDQTLAAILPQRLHGRPR